MSTTSSIVLIVLCVVTVVGSFWVLYGTHPRVPR
jgi:heme/copper-type cytochrome/quinol oxidase subunit 4